jgi:hypothetical protein
LNSLQQTYPIGTWLAICAIGQRRNNRLYEEFLMNSFKRSWRILLLDLLAVLAPILAAIAIYLLMLLSESWVKAAVDIPVGVLMMTLL